jgi:hypothetical protein
MGKRDNKYQLSGQMELEEGRSPHRVYQIRHGSLYFPTEGAKTKPPTLNS